MKKIYLLLVIILLKDFAFSLECDVIPKDNAEIKYSENAVSSYYNFEGKNIIIDTNNYFSSGGIFFKVKGTDYYICEEGILFYKNGKKLDELFKGKNYIACYCVEALYRDDISIVFEYEGNIKKIIEENSKKMDFPENEWFEYMQPVLLRNIDSYLIITGFDDSLLYDVTFIVEKIDTKNIYTFTKRIWDTIEKISSEKINFLSTKLKKYEEDILNYKIDGDYLYFYRNNQLLMSFVNVSEDLITKYKNFVQNNTYSKDDITWPRHADGTCDYDGSKKTVSTQTQKATPSTNVAQNKTMTVKENLKLRSAEATTSDVLTVMSAGTKVKILELGKAENIDGINSNWVKVEVQAEAKDRDGRTIRAGTIGWCYGGYLK